MAERAKKSLWETLTEPRAGELPALDAVRAVAILMLILYHFWVAVGPIAPPVPRFAADVLTSSNAGVTLFFVLSGYLIASILIRELQATSSISLRNFYIKRVFRIVPAYYGFLILSLIPLLLNRAALEKAGVSFALWPVDFLFISNIVRWVHVHTWSLSTEEQFYILFPLIVPFVFRENGRRRWMIVALLYLLPLAFRFAAFKNYSFVDYLDYSYHRPWTRFDDLMAGVAVASMPVRALSKWSRRAILGAGAVSALFALETGPSIRPEWTAIFMNNWVNLSFAAIVFAACRSDVQRVPRLVTATARLSYSMYLWNLLAGGFGISFIAYGLTPGAQITYAKFFKAFAYAFISTAAFSLLSFRFLEMPAMRMRGRFLKPVNVSRQTSEEAKPAP